MHAIGSRFADTKTTPARRILYCLRYSLLYAEGSDDYRTGRLDLSPSRLINPSVSLLTYLDNELQTIIGSPLPAFAALDP